MFSNLSLSALSVASEFPAAVELADRYGFGGLDPDLDQLTSLSDQTHITDLAAELAGRGLRWGTPGLPVNLTAPASEFSVQLTELPKVLTLCTALGVTSLGTWIWPMDEEWPYQRNWARHLGRLSLVADIMADAGMRLGLEYIGPKTLWASKRYPFVHTLAEMRDLIADSGARNIGLILDTFHWYTAGESAADLQVLSGSDIISVDINDAPADRDRADQQDLDRRLPGTTGVINLPEFMRVLHDIGYDGPVRVEPFMKSLGEQPLDVLLPHVSGRVNAAIDEAGRSRPA